ncbi:hypothetical protein JK635_03545 [Neobacillus sp. YIM B02564]|uniref:Uncharacterized protein n=1 Tax=Neobacillus paridis TaxID=2803862 RepID=A0ABS1TN31_9BACI|nr:hypothetical protein [Neobacillus paridis]MBL4951315.1 hypothetical protein [Neobacillus paridis]
MAFSNKKSLETIAKGYSESPKSKKIVQEVKEHAKNNHEQLEFWRKLHNEGHTLPAVCLIAIGIHDEQIRQQKEREANGVFFVR